MKYLNPVILGIAGAIIVITTAVAGAHHALNGQSPLRPYLYAYSVAGLLFIVAAVLAIRTELKERRATTTESRNEVRRKLAVLLRQESELRENLRSSPNDATFTQLIRRLDEWVNAVFSVLTEAALETDAEAFRQVGFVSLTPEQISSFAHIPEWKRDVITRLGRYRQTLDQIISNRRL